MSSFLLLAISRTLDRSALDRGWRTSDILQLACWGTVHPCLTIILISTALERSFDRKFSAVLWLLLGAASAIVGSMRLRTVQGFNRRRVKSGTLYVRTLHLAKKMGVRVKWIYVVPPGRGALTNAFASWRSVALTDNFGEYLHGSQLDAVIAHELAHNKRKHSQKQVALLLLSVCGLTVLSFGLASFVTRYRCAFVLLFLLTIFLSYYGVSRRHEYEADRDAALLTENPEAEIRALVALYRKTNSPIENGRFVELFMSHPALANRIVAIAHLGGMHRERITKILADAGFTDDVLLATR